MFTGTVKWFNSKKGYGFIRSDENDQDVFVHITSLEKNGIHHLNDGQKVYFDIYNDRGKKAAENITLF